jgi:hypothetical protein
MDDPAKRVIFRQILRQLTAAKPFPASSNNVNIPQPFPAARSAFVAPTLPLPTTKTPSSLSDESLFPNS